MKKNKISISDAIVVSILILSMLAFIAYMITPHKNENNSNQKEVLKWS